MTASDILLRPTAIVGHVDIFPFQLGVEAYINDVPEGGGGMLVHPARVWGVWLTHASLGYSVARHSVARLSRASRV